MNASPYRVTVMMGATVMTALVCACGDDGVTPPPDAGMPRDTGVPSGDTGVPDQNLVEVATAAGLSTLVSAAGTAGLADLLSSPGAFTVLAPSDAAFAAAGGDVPSDPGLLANLLLYHVLPFSADANQISQSLSLRNAAGGALRVDASSTPPTVGGASLSTTDVFASNGIAHVIDSVLLPPTIPDAVGSMAQTSTLARVVGLASPAVRTALGTGPITVFAPVNSAFNAIDSQTLLGDAAYLDEVLQFHVAMGQNLAGGFTNGQTLTMSNGQSLTVQVNEGGNVILADAQNRTIRIVQSDIRLRNGVVHLVDRVLLPSRAAVSIAETLRRNNFNTLATAVGTANLTAVLGSGQLTVFAPTDAAFAAAGALPTNPDLLANIILGHVANESLSTQALALRNTLATANGLDVLLDFQADPPTVGGAQVTNATDLVASNGVVHGIDRVLLPPTVAGATQLFSELSTLNQAVGAASMPVQDTLSGAGPVTVFAPVNSAFAGIDVAALIADTTRLDDLLGYHVVTGQTLSTALTDGQTLTMSNGLTLTVRVSGNAVSLVDGVGATVNVTRADVRLANGVVHFIDQVLSPGHLLDQARFNGLSTLVAAVNRAGLAGALIRGGPFTVFAPSDTAFANFATSAGVDLNAVSTAGLTNILNHHIVAGTFGSTQVLAAPSLTNLSNLPLTVSASVSPPRVGGVPLGAPLDATASNGVVHVVNEVIVPPTVLELAQGTADLSTLVEAVGRASSTVVTRLDPNVLVAGRPITVFAPVNAAFMTQNITPGTLTADQLDPILSHHVVPAQLPSSSFMGSRRLGTFNGAITVNRAMDGSMTVTDASANVANVVAMDLGTLNGVVYLIDRVLIPQ